MKLTKEIKTLIFVLFSVLLFIFGFNFLKGTSILDKQKTVYAVYDEVDGLMVGASVSVNGLAIGNVTSLEFLPNSTKILVTLKLKDKLRFSPNSTAILHETGLIGGIAISIDPVFENGNIIKSGDTLKSVIRPGLTELINDQIQPLQRNLQSILVSIDSLFLGVTNIMNKDSQNNLKVAFLEGLFLNDTSRYAKNNTKTLAFIKRKIPVLHPTSLPKKFPFDVFDIILRAEAGAFFDEFLLTKKDETMVEQGDKSRANSLRQTRLIPAVEYIQANRFRTKLIEETNKIFNNYDIIISPSFGKNQLLITNLTGHPAISIPNGLDENNRPTSITFIANYYQEDVLLSFVNSIQKETNHHLNKPPLFY